MVARSSCLLTKQGILFESLVQNGKGFENRDIQILALTRFFVVVQSRSNGYASIQGRDLVSRVNPHTLRRLRRIAIAVNKARSTLEYKIVTGLLCKRSRLTVRRD